MNYPDDMNWPRYDATIGKEMAAALLAMTEIATRRWKPLLADSHEKKCLNQAKAALSKYRGTK